MTPVEEHNSPIFSALLTTAAVVVVVAGIHAARAIIIPLLLAIFIAVILSAILDWLRQRRIKTGVALVLMMLIVGVMGLLMVVVVGASVNELIRKLPQINSAAQKQEQAISKWLEERGLTTDRTDRKENSSRYLEISVPGLLPAPENQKSEHHSSPSSSTDQSPLPSAPSQPPAGEAIKQESSSISPKPMNDSGANPTATQDSPSAPPLPNSEATSQDELFPPDENPPAIKEPDSSPVPEDLQEPTEALSPYERMYPNYIFGPQKHVIEFPSPTASSQVQSPYGGYFEFYSPVQIFRSFLDSVMGMFNYALIVFLMLLFLLLEWSQFGQKLEGLPGNTQSYVEQVAEILASIRRYMFIKTLISLMTGLLITVWLMILGTDYAALWGTVAFLFNYIPTIGSIIAGVVPTLFVLVDQGPIEAVWVAIAFIVVNFLLGNILEPRIMGEGLGLSTFVVFLSLVFWGFVLGPVGMLLAVPLTMAIKIALASEEKTRWIAFILGSGTKFSSMKKLPQDVT